MRRLKAYLPFPHAVTFSQGMANGVVLASLWGVFPVALIVWAIVK